MYYPKQKLELVKRQNTNMPDWYRITIQRLVELARLLSSKYSRKITRDRMPIGYEYIIDELLHTNYDEQNKEKYYDTIIQTMIQLDMADDLIVALSSLIKSLAVDRLHILGDIFDRGPRPDIIMEKLMEHHSVDIQWGNHDILWMGAAAGSRACIANVLNNCLQYDNVDLIEDVYGINLRELALFAQETYGDCPVFTPKVVNTSKHGSKEVRLYAQMKKAIDVIMLKLEVISLSDLLTPWEKIEARLLHAAEADFAICLYNPSSKKRKDYLNRACGLLLRYQSEDTVCAVVRNFGKIGF